MAVVLQKKAISDLKDLLACCFMIIYLLRPKLLRPRVTEMFLDFTVFDRPMYDAGVWTDPLSKESFWHQFIKMF